MSVSTSANQQKMFGLGYQAALDDLAEALERDGQSGVFAWIYDNAHHKTTRASVQHLTGRQGDEQ